MDRTNKKELDKGSFEFGFTIGLICGVWLVPIGL